MTTGHSAPQNGVTGQGTGIDHWRERLGEVTTLRTEQLASHGRRAPARWDSSPDNARIWALERALTRLTASIHELDREIIAERRAADPDESEGLYSAVERRGAATERGRELARELTELSARRPLATIHSILGRHIVAPGLVVDVYFGGDTRDADRLEIVRDRALRANQCSTRSPLGQALLGKHPGQTIRYRNHDGREVVVTIVRIG
ncbi:GreA/GreB family elongation factor [Gordonia rhizosphera]|uniref:Putative transcription elongation factor n=1 Tax=Gordonia rhizosphera NBRC 16068 TaxID=1108045 RepID=K6VX47_9ACTN|nr:GreA/GreB family elongation factor [Gordonia rhizosphera]GAB91495.1 putative transcription elongation factor [Gordonia rhizosphera NBRC 16068]